MPSHGDSSIDLMDRLRERAKELTCLYQVQDVTGDPDRTPDEVCRELVEVIPPGWQHPDACWAKITVDSSVYEPAERTETPWVLRAPVVVMGKPAGAIEVFYETYFPKADEGPFIREERRLLDHISLCLGQFLTGRRLRSMARNWKDAIEQAPGDERRDWRVIIEFLRRTDPHLLTRVSRRMINHLVWSGIDEAENLLEHLGANQREREVSDENRPLERAGTDALMRVSNAAFRVAANNLTDDEIVHVIEQWVKDDKSGYLVEAVENQRTSLTEIADALERFEQMGFGDKELSRSVQIGLRVSLVRRFLTDDLEYINTAKNYLDVHDFCGIVQHVVSPAGSRGKLGGKSSGLLLAYHIVRRSEEYADAIGSFRMPKTWYITSDGLLAFLDRNHLQDIHNRKYLEVEQVRKEYPHIVQAFKNSELPKEVMKGLAVALDDIGDKPLIVRSSSLLEDRIGSAFSGKYKSLFLANRGSKRDRLAAVCDAVAEVYASTFSPDPIEYRAERGLLDLHEEMGIMIQEVVGMQVGRYYLPAFGGVAFSNNEFRWSPRISRDDGLVRLVPGLGTRAVDRLSDDYPVLLSPGQPGLRAKVTPEEQMRYAPTAGGPHQPRRQPLRHRAHRRSAQAIRIEVPDVQAGVLGRRRRRPAPGRRVRLGRQHRQPRRELRGPGVEQPVPGADAIAAPGAAREDRRPGGPRVRPRRHRPLPAAVPPAVGPGRGVAGSHPGGRAERPGGLRGATLRVERPRARFDAHRVRGPGGLRDAGRRGGVA